MARLMRFMVRASRALGEMIPYRIVKVQMPARKSQPRESSQPGQRHPKPKFEDPKTERLYKEVLARRKEANEILA